MKKITKVFLVAAVFLSALLAGCTAVQVNERMFVQLMGIEEDDGLYMLTVQVFDSSKADSQKTVPEYKLYTGQGRSFYEAAEMIMRESGKKLFFGHCEAIFADGSIIRDGEKLKMLAGERISVGCPVIYSEKPSEETGNKDENGELIGADKISAELRRYADEGLYREATLKNVTAAALNSNTEVLPMSRKGICGAAAINENGEVFCLNFSETAAYNLMMGEDNVRLSVLGGSACVKSPQKSVYFRLTDDGGEYTIKIKADCILDETGRKCSIEDYTAETENVISRSAEAICARALREGFLSAVLPEDHAFSGNCGCVAFSADTKIDLAPKT